MSHPSAVTPPVPFTVEQAGPDRWHHGVRVVCDAQAATGLPSSVTPEDLPTHTRDRQQRALGVWLAWASDSDGSRCVGHALCSPVGPAHESWQFVTDPAAVSALAAGRLVSLGGLAVSPDLHQRGVASALVAARLAWLAERGLVGCASVWDSSPGSVALARRHARPVGAHPSLPITLFLYDRT